MMPLLRLCTRALVAFVVFGPHYGAADDYFPTAQWESARASSHPFSAKQLERAAQFCEQQNSSAFLILHQGRIVTERYWDLVQSQKASRRYQSARLGLVESIQPIEDVASVQKSVVSILAGIAMAKGLLRMDDPVHRHLKVSWSKADPAQESKITVRHLLSMTSGLRPNLRYAAPAGSRWQYNSTAYSKSLEVVAAAAKMDHHQLTQQWLTEPLGMKHSKWRDRPAGIGNPYGFATTARDLARFGRMIEMRGRWKQTQIVSQGYLEQAMRPSQKHNPAYGFLWWLNGQEFALRAGGRKANGALIPSAPVDLVAAFGALGRKCYVSAKQQLVVVRLGDAPSDQQFDASLWKLLTPERPSK